MKKLLMLSLFMATIVISCTDDNQLAKKPQPTKAQQISTFLSNAKKEKLTRTDFDAQLEAFMLSIGGKRVDNPERFKKLVDGTLKAPGSDCKIGDITFYEFEDGSASGVQPFEGCTGHCPNGGSGWVIYEFPAGGGVSSEWVCAGEAS